MKNKNLFLGLLLAFPPVAVWMLGAAAPAQQLEPVPMVSQTLPAAAAAPAAVAPAPVQIPVEVVAKGSATQWMYVKVEYQAVPEPCLFPLLALGCLLLLRRHRGK